MIQYKIQEFAGFNINKKSDMFSKTIKKRLHAWWGIPKDVWKPVKFLDLIERYKQTHTRRFKDEPLEKWQRGKYWQRKLTNKWNSRQFAMKFGCPVPELYWYGRNLGNLQIDKLPKQFVIKPVLGYSRKGVYVIDGNMDLMSGHQYTITELFNNMKKVHGRISLVPLLVEEFIKSEDSKYLLPIEYKCHIFGSEVAAVQVISRKGILQKDALHRFYTPQWNTIEDQVNLEYKFDQYREPPKCLDQLLHWAKILGEAYGTYVRADFYASNTGCIFGEFSTTPHYGDGYTDFADEYFGECWKRNLGDKI